MASHSSTLAWKIPWTEEPGRLQSMGSWRVGHDWATSLSLLTFMHWRRKWQPTPVFLPGESQGQRSRVGCRLWGCRVGHDWSDLAAAAAVKPWGREGSISLCIQILIKTFLALKLVSVLVFLTGDFLSLKLAHFIFKMILRGMKRTTTRLLLPKKKKKKRIKANWNVGNCYEPQEQLFWNILHDLGLQYFRARACPYGGKCIFGDKSFKEFFRNLLRSTDLWGAVLNLVLPCTLCKIFVQKYKKHGLMVNVCVLFFLAPEKLMVYVMSVYIL